MQLLERVMLKPIAVPALNKWTKVAPCVRHVSLLQNFCQLAPKAFEAAFQTAGMVADQVSSEDEGEQVGAPVNETKVWRKLAKLRLCKAGFFLQDETARWSTCVWMVLSAPVMRIHYSLFKHATWHTHRKQDLEAQAADALDAFTTVCFCKAAENPAKKALENLGVLNKHNRRPAWVMPANTVVNGWNLFQQDLIARNPALQALSLAEMAAATKTEWSKLSRDQKKHWGALARAQNLDSVDDAASSQVPEQTGGPWNAASSHGFPLARHLIADKCHEATKVGTAFRKAHNVLQPEGADSMSGEPDPQWPLLAPCPVDACEHCLPEASRPTMSRLLDLFWKVILKQAPSLKATGSEPLVVSFHSPSTRRIHDVAVMFHTLRAPHQAALLVLHREESPELMADGILASLHASPLGRFRGQLDILSESMLLAKMATEAQDWEMRIARLGRGQLLSRFDVIGESAIDEDEYLDSRRSREQMEANAALAAFALAHPAEQPKRTSAKKPGQGPAQRPKTQAQNSLQQEKKLQGIIPFLSDSESSHAEDFGAEKAKAKAATAASLAVDEAEVWLGSGCEEVAAPEPAGNAAASSRDPATQRGTVQHRATTWGCFTIGRHTSKFFGDGWVATCGMHHNSDDKTGVVCRKVLPVQNLTEAECKLRLKRWLVAGLDEASMGGSKARSLHLAKGGPRLNHFATGLPEEELDKRVGA
ncbi:unnamed protein product [Symbiodinium sp. CCMP2592]|nr:unnamed protein product [Symbiodinium sp. CCMP2592]